MQHCAQPMQGFRPLPGRSASIDQGIARNGIVVHLWDLRHRTWMNMAHGWIWNDMNGCIGLGKPYRRCYFLPNITQLWLWWMFLVGFPSTKRAWWRCLPVEILGNWATNCPVRASLPQGHLYQQELCHLPLVSSVQTSLSNSLGIHFARLQPKYTKVTTNPNQLQESNNNIVLGCSWHFWRTTSWGLDFSHST